MVYQELIYFQRFSLPNMFLDSSFGNQASLLAQLVKNLHAIEETLIQFLGQEDLEEG